SDDSAVGNPGHRFDVLREAAAIGSEAGSQAGGLVLLALREQPLFTEKAVTAGDVMEAHHAVTRTKLADASTDGDDRAGELVANNRWRLDVTLEDFLDVGTADATSGDLDEDFAVADFGDGDFLDTNDSLLAVDASLHRFRNRAQGRDCTGRCHHAAHWMR